MLKVLLVVYAFPHIIYLRVFLALRARCMVLRLEPLPPPDVGGDIVLTSTAASTACCMAAAAAACAAIAAAPALDAALAALAAFSANTCPFAVLAAGDAAAASAAPCEVPTKLCTLLAAFVRSFFEESCTVCTKEFTFAVIFLPRP